MLFTGDRVTGFWVGSSGVGCGRGRAMVGGAVMSGNPKISSTFLKFPFLFSFFVTVKSEHSDEWQPRVKILLTVSMNESSLMPSSTNCSSDCT